VVRIKELWDRKALQNQLLEQGIQTGIHYQPNHTLTRFRDPDALPLPVTDTVFPTLLTLPLHPDVTEDDVEFVCERLKACLDD
jgi:dTDP-4-amino-4,6-dideoxygalactose transaminase